MKNEIIKLDEEITVSNEDEILKREKELKQVIKELDDKTDRLWEDTLKDTEFLNKFKAVEPIEIGDDKYEIFGLSEKENHLEFGIKESPIRRSNLHSTLLYIIMENGEIPTEENCEENLITLANYAIEKYKISKEIIKQVKEKYEQMKIEELEEITKLLKDIDNIDK